MFVAPHAFLVASACASPAPSSLAIYPHEHGRTGVFELRPRRHEVHALGGDGPSVLSLVVLEAPLRGTVPAPLPEATPADGSEVGFYDFGSDERRADPHDRNGYLQVLIGRWRYPSSALSRFDRGAMVMQDKTVVGVLVRTAASASPLGPGKTTTNGTDIIVPLFPQGPGGVDYAARVRAILAPSTPSR